MIRQLRGIDKLANKGDKMINIKKILAIIPARGGSKGLPGKNIKKLCGKPLINYTIEASLKSNTINRIIVSTDSPAIAEIAKKTGAEVPFIRPSHLATDNAKSIDVVLHIMDWFRENENYEPDVVALFQPTSPLTTAQQIDLAIDKFTMLGDESEFDSVVSVCETEHSPYWASRYENGHLVPISEIDFKNKRRQELPITYRYNGAIYISSREKIYKNKDFLKNVAPFFMEQKYSVDIDSKLDFKFAEFLLKEEMANEKK